MRNLTWRPAKSQSHAVRPASHNEPISAPGRVQLAQLPPDSPFRDPFGDGSGDGSIALIQSAFEDAADGGEQGDEQELPQPGNVELPWNDSFPGNDTLPGKDGASLADDPTDSDSPADGETPGEDESAQPFLQPGGADSTDDSTDDNDGYFERRRLESRDDLKFDRRRARQRSIDAHDRECRTSLQHLRNKRLSDISLDISVTGVPGEDFPRECDLESQNTLASAEQSRNDEPVNVAWTASGLCHKPLYFEETALERYGHSTGPYMQPLASASHFFLTLPILPYKMGLQAPNECVYALGHYRPGSCAPYLVPPVPISLRAGLMQAGATVGAAYLIP